MATETLRPNAAGDETSLPLQIPDSGEHWDKVDEETPDDSGTMVGNGSTSYVRDLYNLPAHSEGSGTINFIKVYHRTHKYSASVTGYAKPSIKSNSSVTDGTEVELITTWTTYSQQWDTNPADGQAWEWADIDALQIGVSIKSGTKDYYSRCTQVYVEVDYTPGGEVTEKSSADVGSGVEGTPLPSATLAGIETGSGIDALIFRLLAAVDTGGGVETGVEIEGLLKNLFASELGEGSDSLTAKIEMPTKGGGMKLWT